MGVRCCRFQPGRLDGFAWGSEDVSLYQNHKDEAAYDVTIATGISSATRLLWGWGLNSLIATMTANWIYCCATGIQTIKMSRREAVLFERRILQAILMMFAAVLLAPLCVRGQQSYAVIAQNGVPMKTRDGVTLYADIYRPKADGKFPVILMRTPYDKSAGWAVGPA